MIIQARTVDRRGRARLKPIHDVKVDDVLVLDVELVVGNVTDELYVEFALKMNFVELLVVELLLLKASTRKLLFYEFDVDELPEKSLLLMSLLQMNSSNFSCCKLLLQTALS